MIACSYYTPNGAYPALARKLAESLHRFAIQFNIYEVPDPGSWLGGLQLKPELLLQELLKHRRPILWLDVDCELWRPPVLLGEAEGRGYDFASFNFSPRPLDPVLSGGVLLFGYTAAAIELLIRWQQEYELSEDKIDDHVLTAAYVKHRPPVKPLWLPATYNRLSTHWPELAAETVINHDYRKGAHREVQADATKPTGQDDPTPAVQQAPACAGPR